MAKPATSNIDREIGLRLKKLRQQEGISAATLAEAIGSTQQQISRYENAQNKISASQLYLLSKSLSVPLAWFFLDCDITTSNAQLKTLSSQLSERKPPHYNRDATEDETETLQAIWPRLSAAQRSATLKLLDSFLE